MIRPPDMGAFEFVVLASLRTAQLMRGCTPKISGDHKHAVTAQCEVAAGLVTNTRAASPEEQPAAGASDLAAVMATPAA
jgi:DNA-directed RNA polymerase subunit K/omega